jgi:hypothetical protein
MPWKYNPFTDEMQYYEKDSDPPLSGYQIVNMYVDKVSGKLIVEYEDET